MTPTPALPRKREREQTGNRESDSAHAKSFSARHGVTSAECIRFAAVTS